LEDQPDSTPGIRIPIVGTANSLPPRALPSRAFQVCLSRSDVPTCAQPGTRTPALLVRSGFRQLGLLTEVSRYFRYCFDPLGRVQQALDVLERLVGQVLWWNERPFGHCRSQTRCLDRLHPRVEGCYGCAVRRVHLYSLDCWYCQLPCVVGCGTCLAATLLGLRSCRYGISCP